MRCYRARPIFRPSPHPRPLLPIELLVLALLVCDAPSVRAEQGLDPSAPRGEVLFETCRVCHGDRGEGVRSLHTPPLAGLPAWYIEAQLQAFRAGTRGVSRRDIRGWQMRQQAQALEGEEALRAVAAHLAGLPKIVREPQPQPESRGGAEAYTSFCAPCHGARAEGNEAQGAPPLAGMPRWYMKTQVAHFAEGLRGGEGADARARAMAEAMAALPETVPLPAILAYLESLYSPP